MPSVPARLLRVHPERPDPDVVAEAAAVLREGGLVGLPTETVYGLAAHARSAEAVRRVFAAKCRPADNPLIVHVDGSDALPRVAAAVTPLAASLAERWWPGPLTLVVDAANDLPSITTGGLDSVGVRVPAHAVALAVLRATGLPLAAPSANRSGRPSPTTAAHVVADLGSAVDLVLDAGPCRVGVESTVVDARGLVPVVLRPGAVSANQLGLAVAPAAAPGGADRTVDPGVSPGTRYRHYAPRCRVAVAPIGRGAAMATALSSAGERVGLLAPAAAPDGVLGLGRPRDAEALARRLFAALRAGEAAGVDVVVVEAVEEHGLGVAIMDRLRRAASG